MCVCVYVDVRALECGCTPVCACVSVGLLCVMGEEERVCVSE